MTRLMIPRLRDELTLAEPWTFALHDEYRNDDLRVALKHKTPYAHLRTFDDAKFQATLAAEKGPRDATLPAGTVLSVDRIFIRNGARDYDSVTFRFRKHPDMPKLKARFWVKLDDANKIVFNEHQPS